LKGECRLGIFGNRVQRRIFGPKRWEVTGTQRKLLNQEVRSLYSAPDIRVIMSERMKCPPLVVFMGDRRNVYKILARKVEGKRPL
jgi:hypothetical protein